MYLLYDILRVAICHSNFTGHVHKVVLGHAKSGWTQTISVQDGSNVTTISEGQQSWEERYKVEYVSLPQTKIFSYIYLYHRHCIITAHLSGNWGSQLTMKYIKISRKHYQSRPNPSQFINAVLSRKHGLVTC